MNFNSFSKFLFSTFIFLAVASSNSSFANPEKHEVTQEENSKTSAAKTETKSTAVNSKSNLKDGWGVIGEIQAGNKRFSEGRPSHPGQDKSTREKLASGQQPPVIVLSCSDSRVPPEKIFDQGLGQIFTVRLAGHVLNSDAIASIEYAVEHLHSKALVVMGHDSCGAVKAALTTPVGKSTGSPHLDALIAKIKPNLSSFKKLSADDKTLEGPVKANVMATVKDLVKRSKIIRDAVESENFLIAQGIYHLDSGVVEFWSIGQPIVIVDDTKSRQRREDVSKEN